MEKLTFSGGLPSWGLILIALGTCALLVYQFVGLREHLSLRQSALLVSLRGSVYALLILFLTNPVFVEERVTQLRRPLVLLLDTSESMGFPASQQANGGKSRIEILKEKLLGGNDPLIQRLARDYDLRLYQFNTTLQPVGLESVGNLTAHGKGTRLLEALGKVGRDSPSTAGIILLSDGIANGTQSLETFSSMPMPVFTVSIGEVKGFTDLRIANLRTPEFAFRGREIKMDFTVEAYGLEGKEVPLYFTRGRNLISTRSITIDRDPFKEQVSLTYTPKEIGPHSFSLKLPSQAGEQIIQNNQKDFKIDVQRDKIRVLSLSGSPSWNYRFLRLALKQDPFIDLISFVFLRTPTDAVDVPENQLSLIPFPIDEILKELENFDLIIFDNFSHRSYFNTTYLEKIRDFVQEGGGFAMLGGIRSFDSGGYFDSPLNGLLPVELDGKGGYQMNTNLQAGLASAGKAHPVTRIFPDPRANEEAWKKIPSLTTFNRVVGPKGEVLLWAARDNASRGWPLLTVEKFGKGRTLAILSDDLWRWNFIAVGEQESSQVHQRLIRQAVRWLTQESLFEQVQIVSMEGSKSPGEQVEFLVRVLKDDFTPAPQGAIQLRVTSPDGEQIPLEVVQGTTEGEYTAVFTPTKEGVYELAAEGELSGKILGKDKKNFVVSFAHAEIEDGRPRVDLLTRIAEISQGDSIPVSQWSDNSWRKILTKLKRRSPSEIIERRENPLWSSPWILALILLLLGFEWWQRRSWGLI